jgi:hypothetical protein
MDPRANYCSTSFQPPCCWANNYNGDGNNSNVNTGYVMAVQGRKIRSHYPDRATRLRDRAANENHRTVYNECAPHSENWIILRG